MKKVKNVALAVISIIFFLFTTSFASEIKCEKFEKELSEMSKNYKTNFGHEVFQDKYDYPQEGTVNIYPTEHWMKFFQSQKVHSLKLLIEKWASYNPSLKFLSVNVIYEYEMQYAIIFFPERNRCLFLDYQSNKTFEIQ